MKTAVVMPAYKKYDILKEVIFRLSENKKYDLIINFDYHNDDLTEIKKYIRSYFPDAVINQRAQRFNLDLNVVFSIHEAFTKYGCDRIFYVEDDVFCVPSCLETLENLMNWTERNLPEAGIVQSWNYNFSGSPFKDEYYILHGLNALDYTDECTYADNEIGFTGQNYWGAMISRKCWEAVGPYVMRHFISYANGRGFDFSNYNKLIAKLLLSKASLALKHRVVSRFNVLGWEPILDLAMIANDYYKVCLTNPRSCTAGVVGATSTDDMFYKVGLDKISLQKFDNAPVEFVLNKKSKDLFLQQNENNESDKLLRYITSLSSKSVSYSFVAPKIKM